MQTLSHSYSYRKDRTKVKFHAVRWMVALMLAAIILPGCGIDRFTATSGWSGPVISEDNLYIGSLDAKLLALHKDSGQLLWQFPNKDEPKLSGIYGAPATKDDSVFVGAYGSSDGGLNGTLYSINTSTQREEWRFETEGTIVGSPVVYEDIVMIGSSDGNLYAIDTKSGTEMWRFTTGNSIWSTPAVYEGIVYFGSLDHTVYAVSLSNRSQGQEIWRFLTGGAVASTPLVKNGRVYIGSFDRRFYALDASTGQQTWVKPFEAQNWFWTEAVSSSDGSTIFVGSLDGNLYALNSTTGTHVWPTPFSTENPIMSSPAIIPEGVVVANDNGDIYLVRVQDGREIRSFSAKDRIRAPIAASGSMVYFSAMNHSIRAANLQGGFWTEIWCRDTQKDTRQCQ